MHIRVDRWVDEWCFGIHIFFEDCEVGLSVGPFVLVIYW